MEPLQFTVWQVIAACLLKRHFGLSLNDTALCETDTAESLRINGIRPFEAINGLVDKYDLTRLDGNTVSSRTPYLRIQDEWHVFFYHGSLEDLLRDIG
ncbi:TA system toxin CbtA family protein [Xenorhabdus doucetiae]|uniref:Cytoskeleton-binding toxin CbtA-like protein n=1 Tax=Xenorhabdus doucetiae TaxID=351671 RepID=A0A068QQC7_9GAMM|nr:MULTISPECIES: TA system toxin CbtA family protein [Xenorhabdus]MBD2786481.1 toxin-antitoxin protein [Xenorhabdus sp. 3]MBD2790100.1 toxin-antitoxin protein [Xenorhabdus sp. DI]TYP16512.1 cytoskeleton-binding toxin CbtA-like protein [Xenorhabdus doucetiae]CDG16831.1 putative toxin-antitoxin system protein [Xenorhabdus doucetiae]